MQDSKHIIQTVLKGQKTKDLFRLLEVWCDYLSEHLDFPFEAEVKLFSYCRVFEDGDIVKVNSVESYTDTFGLIMEVKKSRNKYYTPLLELTATDKKSKNHQLIEAYKDWFDNR